MHCSWHEDASHLMRKTCVEALVLSQNAMQKEGKRNLRRHAVHKVGPQRMIVAMPRYMKRKAKLPRMLANTNRRLTFGTY
jgi:hypothetical protein